LDIAPPGKPHIKPDHPRQNIGGYHDYSFHTPTDDVQEQQPAGPPENGREDPTVQVEDPQNNPQAQQTDQGHHRDQAATKSNAVDMRKSEQGSEHAEDSTP